MDQVMPAASAHAVATSARSGERSGGSPRIYYVNPLELGPLAKWEAAFAWAASLGFSHILTAPIFAGPTITLPADFAAPHPVLACSGDAVSALRRMAELARAHGLTLLMDVALDRVAAAGRISRERPDLFALPDAAALDPRRFPAEADAALARFEGGHEALAAFWEAQFAAWHEAGVSGFRITSLADTPAALVSRIARSGHYLLFGWLPTIAAEHPTGFESCGLDFVLGVLPAPEPGSDRLWTEHAALRRVAPLIACVEAPFGPRFAASLQDPTVLPIAQSRAAALASALGDGWMMPMGFEHCARHALDSRAAGSSRRSRGDGFDITKLVRTANAAVAAGELRPLLAAGKGEIAFLRSDADPRYARTATLTVANADIARRATIELAPLLEAAGGRFQTSDDVAVLSLAPGAVRTLALREAPPIRLDRPPLAVSAAVAAREPRVGIEAVAPIVEGGAFAAKRGAGEIVTVTCDLLADGHDKLAGVVKWRTCDSETWHEVRMQPVANDRWGASFPLSRVGRHEYVVEAWRDVFASYRDELSKKHAAGIDVRLELMEGRELVTHANPDIGHRLEAMEVAEQVAILLSAETAALMAKADKRPWAARTQPFAVEADRLAARFANWYEIFPRSMSDDPLRHGTFRDVIRHLPRIRDMGFDVMYFPPIHPIGRVNRKGRNNALKAAEGDVGSPYAIGGEEGGHDALHPELGSFEDFQALRAAAESQGIELAIDFAIQCAPDHPWLKQHHAWFAWRPDGSMKYAENPPKKYEDIVNVDFYAGAAIPDLWVALCEVVMFWAEQGVRIIRVDNPHTKPFPFWHWMIAEVRARYPDVLFLAEAFTRPKLMNRLGKLGFTQSYTYFTWRNTKRELQEYLTELTGGVARDFFRPNFFVNTPDINPPFLQTGGRPAHLIRAALAATLSGLWGVYCGFELCEATPLPGREEYLDSEKYQIRVWDWSRPGNIVAEITALNKARRLNPALQTHLGVTFLPSDNDQIMFYEKATPDRSNVVLVAVNLDPARTQSAQVELPMWQFALSDSATLLTDDLMANRAFAWTGKWQTITLNPSMPFALWRVRPAT